jgi:hypothetical protein
VIARLHLAPLLRRLRLTLYGLLRARAGRL